MVLSITLKEGSNVKYLLKPPTDAISEATSIKMESRIRKSHPTKSQDWSTAFNLGESPLSPGMAVKVSN